MAVLHDPECNGLIRPPLATPRALVYALDPDHGDHQIWSAKVAMGGLLGGVMWGSASDGRKRAYETRKGQVIWDFDTAREFQTANGVKARAGCIDCGGPAVAHAMLLTNSGYAMFGGTPGNVLPAFGVDSAAP